MNDKLYLEYGWLYWNIRKPHLHHLLLYQGNLTLSVLCYYAGGGGRKCPLSFLFGVNLKKLTYILVTIKEQRFRFIRLLILNNLMY